MGEGGSTTTAAVKPPPGLNELEKFKSVSSEEKQELMFMKLIGMESNFDMKVEKVLKPQIEDMTRKIDEHSREDKTWKNDCVKKLAAMEERIGKIEQAEPAGNVNYSGSSWSTPKEDEMQELKKRTLHFSNFGHCSTEDVKKWLDELVADLNIQGICQNGVTARGSLAKHRIQARSSSRLKRQ